MLKAKENLLRAIRHDHPRWVPNRMEAVRMVDPPVCQRPGEAALDAFGHSVPYDKQLLAAMNDEIATYGRQIYATARNVSV